MTDDLCWIPPDISSSLSFSKPSIKHTTVDGPRGACELELNGDHMAPPALLNVRSDSVHKGFSPKRGLVTVIIVSD